MLHKMSGWKEDLREKIGLMVGGNYNVSQSFLNRLRHIVV